MNKGIYLGLISGTSMDAIDAALVRFPESGVELIATHTHPWPAELRRELQALATPGENEIDRLGRADAEAGEQFAKAALELQAKAGLPASAVTAVGSHGQTVRHRPNATPPFTLQIGDPNRIAELTGITTVGDLRRRDMAVGGEGAPLVPALHAALFASAEEYRAVLNIGGIANLTLLLPGNPSAVSGFDTGPGNCLLDGWARHHLNQPCDRNGDWAASGEVHSALLENLLEDDYFRRPPPKSTGPEYFSPDWFEKHLALFPTLPPQDVQATLAALTVESIARALDSSAPGCRRLLVCGGGIHNGTLMSRLRHRLGVIEVESTASYGLDPDWVEAVAMAWLARRTLHGLSGNLTTVTGADHSVVLGGVYPGGKSGNKT